MTDVDLTSSRRQLQKVTYTPLTLPESADGGAALQLAAAVDQLGLLPGEARAAARQQPQEVVETLSTMDGLASATYADERLAAAGQLARFATPALTAAAGAVRAARDEAIAQVIRDMTALTRRYADASATRDGGRDTGRRPGGGLDVTRGSYAAIGSPAAGPHGIGGPAAGPQDIGQPASGPLALRETGSGDASSVWPGGTALARVSTTLDDARPVVRLLVEVPQVVAERLGPTVAAQVVAALDWAGDHDVDEVGAMLARPAAVVPAPLRDTGLTLLVSGLPFLIRQSTRTAAFGGHLTQRNLQPCGLLHLERVVLTPLTVQRGELLYSLPLAPKEKVTLSHKEWALREEEYTRFVQEYLQNYSERGVADSNDISVASSAESEHTKTLSMTKPNAPGSVTIADPVDAKTTTTDVTTERQSQQQSRRDIRQITEKASALAVRDQKISFTVNTVSGTEDFTSRLYENAHADKVLIVDYYRRMRRWRGELFRTGLRMTYDVVLPDPGRVLRERWLAVKAVDEQLATGFQFDPPDFAPARAVRSAVGQLTAPVMLGGDSVAAAIDRLDALARSLGTSLPPAPDTVRAIEQTHTVTEGPVRDEALVFSVSLPVDRAYRITALWMGGQIAHSDDPNVFIEGEWWSRKLVVPADGTFHQHSIPVPPDQPAAITVDFTAHKGAMGAVRVWANVEPTVATWRDWYAKVCAILRQAAFARYTDQRELLRQRRAALLNELNATDALTLRRMEREQVMRLVLQWLFPDFAGAGDAYRDAAQAAPAGWEPAMEYGEYIKFVHQAIDWDRALVLLYPYFWDAPEHRAAKLYLDHPDPTHREFLRAGAARVVLAIRPGYEEEVVSLLDRGHLGKLAPGSRFLPVIQAVREAERRYAEGLDTDLVPGDDGVPLVSNQGVQIGEWYDWTPTSALDIEVTVRPLAEG
jgi:hypothetical protein